MKKLFLLMVLLVGIALAAPEGEPPPEVAQVMELVGLFPARCAFNWPETSDRKNFCGLTQLNVREFKAALADIPFVEPWKIDERTARSGRWLFGEVWPHSNGDIADGTIRVSYGLLANGLGEVTIMYRYFPFDEANARP